MSKVLYVLIFVLSVALGLALTSLLQSVAKNTNSPWAIQCFNQSGPTFRGSWEGRIYLEPSGAVMAGGKVRYWAGFGEACMVEEVAKLAPTLPQSPAAPARPPTLDGLNAE